MLMLHRGLPSCILLLLAVGIVAWVACLMRALFFHLAWLVLRWVDMHMCNARRVVLPLVASYWTQWLLGIIKAGLKGLYLHFGCAAVFWGKARRIVQMTLRFIGHQHTDRAGKRGRGQTRSCKAKWGAHRWAMNVASRCKYWSHLCLLATGSFFVSWYQLSSVLLIWTLGWVCQARLSAANTEQAG